MIVRPRNDSFARDFNAKYEQDTDIICAVCGHGIFRGDNITWDQNRQICHAECVEESVYAQQNFY